MQGPENQPALPEQRPGGGRDPFPGLTFARKYLWNFVDQNAYRRMLRLGVPSPWHAYQMGYEAARTEIALEQARRRDGERDKGQA